MSEEQDTSPVIYTAAGIKILCVSTKTATLDAIYIEMDTVRAFVGYIETVYDGDEPDTVYYRAMPLIDGYTNPAYPINWSKEETARHVASYAVLKLPVEVVIQDHHREYRRLHALRALGNIIDDDAMQQAAQTARGESHTTQ